MRGRRAEWPELQELGLCSGIDSFTEYVRRVTAGEAAGALLILSDARAVPDVSYIQSMHRCMFASVHPWAGQFTPEGQAIWIAGMLACPPRFIVRNLETLAAETMSLLGPSDAAKARAVAFYHTKFERIHPFLDGNGRVGRMLMDSQRQALFGLNSQRGAINGSDYFKFLIEAQRRSNLRPFLNFILSLEQKPTLPGKYERLPFRIRCYEGSVEEKRAWRKIAKQQKTSMRALRRRAG